MPTQKDLKRLVRRRMKKTGESYTTARAQLLQSRRSPATRRTSPAAANGTLAVATTRRPARPAKSAKPARPARPAKSAKPDYAKLAGMSDAAIQAATGCTWEKWVGALDYVHADTWSHRRIAEYVQQKFKVQDWWTQAVTVGYERIRGLREIGQRRGGSFEATKSRTFPVPVSDLYAAFADAAVRSRWLPGVALTVRKATPHRSVRITWPDRSSVEVWLVARGAKSSAQVAHRKLPDRDAVARTKAFWDERLDALAVFLTR